MSLNSFNEVGIPLRERLGCTVNEACAATGLKPTKLYELISVGAIETVKVGRRRLVLVRSLVKLIEGGASDHETSVQ